jgi:hypothetical protein
MVLTEKTLEEIISYLDKSINNLAKDAFENLEVEGGFSGVENFLQNQFDVEIRKFASCKKEQHPSFRVRNEKQDNSKKTNNF